MRRDLLAAGWGGDGVVGAPAGIQSLINIRHCVGKARERKERGTDKKSEIKKERKKEMARERRERTKERSEREIEKSEREM